MNKRRFLKFSSIAILGLVIVLAGAHADYAWAPVPVEDDPLVRMPGTQPGK